MPNTYCENYYSSTTSSSTNNNSNNNSNNNCTILATNPKDNINKKIEQVTNPIADGNTSVPKPIGSGKPNKAAGKRDETSSTQFFTDCSKQHRESLQCIERNYENRGACEPFFQAYKDCRREENERRRQANAKNGGGWSFCNIPFLLLLLLLVLLNCPTVSSFTILPFRRTRLFLCNSNKLNMVDNTNNNDNNNNIQVGLISFDLDDTLFDTSAVVQDANRVMLNKIKEFLPSNNEDCQDSMTISIENFLETTRSIRKSLTEPITYTNLRKLSIRKTLQKNHSNGLSTLLFDNTEKDLNSIVDTCYNAWLRERHVAAERHLFPNVINMLQELRQLYPNVCIAAITNGAGNPLQMTSTLSPWFDFCISGEDDDIFPHRKPDPIIYQKALEKYQLQQHESDGNDNYESSSTNNNNNNDNYLWFHIGDCLANDVGASGKCGAKAIWMCWDDSNEVNAESRLTDPKKKPFYSTASLEQLNKRAQQAAEGKKYMAGKIYNLQELPIVIQNIALAEQQESSSLPSNNKDLENPLKV